MKVYVASSWRNPYQQEVVEWLRAAAFEVYDFRKPADWDGSNPAKPGDRGYGFHWSDIDPDWLGWSTERFAESLDHPIAVGGFESDMRGLRECDAVVLVLPCGRSAHLEAGWAAGAHKPVVVFSPERLEPELMYRMCWGGIAGTLPAVVGALEAA